MNNHSKKIVYHVEKLTTLQKLMIWLFEPEFGLEYMIRLDMKTDKYIIELWIEYGKEWDVGNGMIC